MNQHSLLPVLGKLQDIQERIDETYYILSQLAHEIKTQGHGCLTNMPPEAIAEVGDAIVEVAHVLGQYTSEGNYE